MRLWASVRGTSISLPVEVSEERLGHRTAPAAQEKISTKSDQHHTIFLLAVVPSLKRRDATKIVLQISEIPSRPI